MVGLAGNALPRRLTPLPELLLDNLFQFRYPLQRLAEGADGVAEPFDSPGNTFSKSFSKPVAKVLQISSALRSFAFTLLTALAISCFAFAS